MLEKKGIVENFNFLEKIELKSQVYEESESISVIPNESHWDNINNDWNYSPTWKNSSFSIKTEDLDKIPFNIEDSEEPISTPIPLQPFSKLISNPLIHPVSNPTLFNTISTQVSLADPILMRQIKLSRILIPLISRKAYLLSKSFAKWRIRPWESRLFELLSSAAQKNTKFAFSKLKSFAEQKKLLNENEIMANKQIYYEEFIRRKDKELRDKNRELEEVKIDQGDR